MATRRRLARRMSADTVLDWLQRSLEEHQQYSSPDLDWKHTSWNRDER